MAIIRIIISFDAKHTKKIGLNIERFKWKEYPFCWT